MVLVLNLSKIGIAYADQKCLACYRSHRNNLSKRKVLLQVREMRLWFKEKKLLGDWNEKDFKNLISLTNYHRAKGVYRKLSFIQILKITLRIKNFYLMMRFLVFLSYKLLFNKFVHKNKK